MLVPGLLQMARCGKEGIPIIMAGWGANVTNVMNLSLIKCFIVMLFNCVIFQIRFTQHVGHNSVKAHLFDYYYTPYWWLL